MAERNNLTQYCVCFWIVLVFSYSIIMLSIFSAEIKVLNAIQTSTSKYDYDQLLGFSDSLLTAYQLTSLDPIQELYLIFPNSSCLANDELLNLKIWNSNPICSYPFSNSFIKGTCSNSSAQNKLTHCYTVEDQRFFMTNWGDVQFCVRRFNQNESQWYLRNGFFCDQNYLSCPNNICVLGDKCPITSLLIGNSSNQTLQSNISQYNYSLIGSINNMNQLYASRDYNSPFIIDLAVGIDGIPCIDELEAMQRSTYLSLLKAIPNNCQNYGSDPSIYTQIDTQREWIFYEQNNIQYVIAGLNLENYTSNDSASLYSVIRTVNSCPQGNFLIDSDDSDITSFISLRNGANIYGLIAICGVLIMLFIHFFGIIGEKKPADSIVISSILLVFIFVEEIMCPISLNYLGKIVKNDQFLNTMISSQCFQNSGYNSLFQDYGDQILIDSKKSYGFIHTILYFSLIVFILDVLYFIDKIVTNIFFNREDNGVLEDFQFSNCICNGNDNNNNCNFDCDCQCDDCLF